MSTERTKKPGAGIFLLPFIVAVPVAAALAITAYRAWPMIQKAVNIMIKLVVKA